MGWLVVCLGFGCVASGFEIFCLDLVVLGDLGGFGGLLYLVA